MQSELGGVQTHVVEPRPKPGVKFMPEKNLEVSVTIGNPENGRVAMTIVFAVNFTQTNNSFYRTEERIFRRRQRDLVDPLTKLIVLGFRNREHDTILQVVVQWLDVRPAQDHLEIHVVVGPGDHITRAEHGEEIEETEVFKDLNCLVVDKVKMWWNL